MHAPAELVERKAGLPSWVWLLVVPLLVNFCWLGSNRALTEHEALMAGSAKQMVASGDWLVLRIGDRTWLEKPPLPQWLAALSAILGGGFTEWTMRLPFALAGVVVVLLEARLMTRMFNPQVGWLSGLIQATTVYMAMYARLAEADMLLLALFLGAIAVFQELETQRDALSERQQRRLRLAFWLLLGAANLVKGVGFGAALAVLTCSSVVVLNRDWTAIRRWWSWSGLLLAFGIAAAWPVAVVWREPDVLTLWRDHTLGRAAGTLGYTEPWWYYFVQWPVQMLPWTPLLLMAAPASLVRARQTAGPDRFLWWWFLSHFALLSCSSGKHHHYLIYALPALSPIAAQGLLICREQMLDRTRSLRLPTLGWALGAAGTCVACGCVAFLRPDCRVDAAGVAVLVGGGGAGLAVCLWRRRSRAAWTTVLTVIVLGHLYAQAVVMPRRDVSAADKRFLADVERRVAADAPLAACGSQEIARHIFYLHRPVIAIWDFADLRAAAPSDRTLFVIARSFAAPELKRLGAVERIAQSQFTRRERTPDDRYALFRITPQSFLANSQPGTQR